MIVDKIGLFQVTVNSDLIEGRGVDEKVALGLEGK